MMNIFFIWILRLKYLLKQCRQVGQDLYGNTYYEEITKDPFQITKRWVIYQGLAEPSKIPAEWGQWLRHTIHVAPAGKHFLKHSWQKSHQPNCTGTKSAYYPLAEKKKQYEPWRPH